MIHRKIAACLTLAIPLVASAQTETLYALADPTFPVLFTLDKQTGEILESEFVTGAEALFGGLAVDDAGVLYSLDGFNDGESDRLFVIDPATGNGMVVGPTGFNWNFRSVTVHPQTDVLYGARDNQLFTIDKATGDATSVAIISGPSLDQLTSFVIAPDGTAYGTDIGSTGLFEIDLETGAATHLGDIGQSGNWFEDIAFDADGVLWGVRQQGGVYTIDVDAASADLAFGGLYAGIVFVFEGGPCPADCNGDGQLNVLDFVCFQGEFDNQTDAGDCDGNGQYNILDFVCFQGLFQDGCP